MVKKAAWPFYVWKEIIKYSKSVVLNSKFFTNIYRKDLRVQLKRICELCCSCFLFLFFYFNLLFGVQAYSTVQVRISGSSLGPASTNAHISLVAKCDFRCCCYFVNMLFCQHVVLSAFTAETALSFSFSNCRSCLQNYLDCWQDREGNHSFTCKSSQASCALAKHALRIFCL